VCDITAREFHHAVAITGPRQRSARHDTSSRMHSTPCSTSWRMTYKLLTSMTKLSAG
jgi:hypothetical protein